MELGLPEILIVLGLALLFFGPTRLPALGQSLGSAVRSFKRSLNGEEDVKPASAEVAAKDAVVVAPEAPAALPAHPPQA